MSSIFDDDDDRARTKPAPEPEKIKRSKKREALTPSEVAAGKVKLATMVDRAFETLEEAMRSADHGNAIKAAQILLDRAGFGPKTTVDVNATHTDLTQMTKEQLAERAAQLSQKLRGMTPTPIVPGTGTVQ